MDEVLNTGVSFHWTSYIQNTYLSHGLCTKGLKFDAESTFMNMYQTVLAGNCHHHCGTSYISFQTGASDPAGSNTISENLKSWPRTMAKAPGNQILLVTETHDPGWNDSLCSYAVPGPEIWRAFNP